MAARAAASLGQRSLNEKNVMPAFWAAYFSVTDPEASKHPRSPAVTELPKRLRSLKYANGR